MLRFVARFGVLVVVGALVVLGATGSLFSSAPPVVAAQLLALGLSAWARRSFPTGGFRVAAEPGADALIRRGPYRLIRHPMYAAALLFIWAAVLAHLS